MFFLQNCVNMTKKYIKNLSWGPQKFFEWPQFGHPCCIGSADLFVINFNVGLLGHLGNN